MSAEMFYGFGLLLFVSTNLNFHYMFVFASFFFLNEFIPVNLKHLCSFYLSSTARLLHCCEKAE